MAEAATRRSATTATLIIFTSRPPGSSSRWCCSYSCRLHRSPVRREPSHSRAARAELRGRTVALELLESRARPAVTAAWVGGAVALHRRGLVASRGPVGRALRRELAEAAQ